MKKVLLTILAFLFLTTPAVFAKDMPSHTQLEIRQMQTREYDTTDKTLIMKAMLNVLQDDGYIIYNANPLLGSIFSVKEFDSTSTSAAIASEYGLSQKYIRWAGVSAIVVDSNANVTEFGKKIRVRMSFKLKMLNTYGSVSKVINLESPEYYQTFFSKVDKAIFLQKQKI